MSHPSRYTFDHVTDGFSVQENLLGTVYEEDDQSSPRSWPSFCRQCWNALDLWCPSFSELDTLPGPNRWASKRRRQREVRRCRRSFIIGVLKRVFLTSPVIILSMFGVLHVLQFLVGRSRLFWNADRVEFLPDLDREYRFDNGMFRSTTSTSYDVLPIPVHSHNDYWRREPLFDAISWGCISVEADVWLFDEELYVGHTVSSLKRDHTFSSMYVDKLVEILDKANAKYGPVKDNDSLNGVFHRKPEQALTLMVDFKRNGHGAFPVLQKQLEPLREKNYLSYWNGQEIIPRAVTIVGTGDTPFDMVIENTTYRDIFFDAPLSRLWESPRDPIGHEDPIRHLDSKIDYGHAMSIPAEGDTSPGQEYISIEQFNTNTSYYASTSFEKAVGFVWRGHLSPRQMEIIRGQIRGAKRRGLKARYWNTPSWPIALRNHVWHVLMKEGADILSVDDLGAAARQSWTARVQELW